MGESIEEVEAAVVDWNGITQNKVDIHSRLTTTSKIQIHLRLVLVSCNLSEWRVFFVCFSFTKIWSFP